MNSYLFTDKPGYKRKRKLSDECFGEQMVLDLAKPALRSYGIIAYGSAWVQESSQVRSGMEILDV